MSEFIKTIQVITNCLQNPKEAPQKLINELLLKPLVADMIDKKNKLEKNVFYVFCIKENKLAVKVGYKENNEFIEIYEPIYASEFLLSQFEGDGNYLTKTILKQVVSMIAKLYNAQIDNADMPSIIEKMFDNMKQYMTDEGIKAEGTLSYILRFLPNTEKPIILEFLESPKGNEVSQINPQEIIRYFEEKAEEKKK